MSDQFRTIVKPVKPDFSISHQDAIYMAGSCFAENIGQMLSRAKFNVQMNSHGIIFNPLSLATSLEDVILNREYEKSVLVEKDGVFHSLNHHGKFNSPSAENTIGLINHEIEVAHKFLLDSKLLLITFGSSWIYRYKKTGEPVANCHKFGQQEFVKELIEPSQIVERWKSVILDLRKKIPEIKIVITISPVRHWRDGVVENQLSKAGLVIATQQLVSMFPHVKYFPSYEIMLDDLRDYRFYKEDMLHPNAVAINYIWDIFSDWLFDDLTQSRLHRIEPLLKFLEHKPMHTSKAHHAELCLMKEAQIAEILK